MAQQCPTMKARPLGKDEVMVLLDFISKNTKITSKATNATNNRLKKEAWKVIAQEYSAQLGENRRPEQLRLKWENLKKAARKRSAAIRQNNLKTGGGKSYIIPDEVLDRVASLLGATCSGFTVEYGGDAKELQPEEPMQIAWPDAQPLPEEANIITLPLPSNKDAAQLSASSGIINGMYPSDCRTEKPIYSPKTFLFNTPKSSLNKRRKLTEELHKAQIEKELALAAYFRAKTEKLELENIKFKYEIETLKKNLE